MGEITQAKTQGQDCPEKENGFRVTQELGTWDVPIVGVGWGGVGMDEAAGLSGA